MSESPLRIALHTGVLFEHDAVSNSLLEKLAAVAEARRGGAAVQAVALVDASDLTRPDVAIVSGAAGVLEHPWFWSADVHIYEFGIWYQSFDTVFVVPDCAPTIAVYHNVTPPELARSSEARALLERSCGKKANLAAFDHVACDSEFNRAELVDMGLDPARLSLTPLPPSVDIDVDSIDRRPEPGAPVSLLYVGRFVAAKGVLDLLEAVRLATAIGTYPFQLKLAGNQRLSDPEVVDQVQRLAALPELASVVELTGEVSDDQLAGLYASCDALVLPSYHEGYCVPVVEAVSAGAHVLTSDAGNLPYVVRRVGRTVPTGDVDALAKAITELVDRLGRARRGEALEVLTDDGPLDEATWQARVAEHRAAHSRSRFRSSMWEAVARALASAGRPIPDWLVSA